MPKVGGARIGAGAKPKIAKVAVMRARVEDSAVSVIAPEDMPVEQRVLWAEWAPLAIEMQTLTPQTVPSFRLLCALEAERQKVARILDEDGRTFVRVSLDGAGVEHQELKAHPLKADLAKLYKQVEVLMARFCLAPFGKPAVTVAPKARTETRITDDAYFGPRR